MPYDTIEAPPPLELLEVAVDDEAGPVASPPRPVRPWLRGAVIAAVVVGVAATALWATSRPGGETDPAELAARPYGLEGFAEMYVATYLTAVGDEGAAELRRFYAAGPDGAELEGADRWVARTAAVAVTQPFPGQWEVTVAADVLSHDGLGYRRDGIQHYVVGVVEGPAGLAATSLPARIPAPPPAPLPAASGETVVDDPAVGALVAGFFSAYLTGAGDLRAFASEDVSSAVPDAFVAVEVTGITAVPDPEGLMRLRVRGTARDGGGHTLPIEYHLVVAAEGGTMRIAAVTAGPPPSNPTG
jgi:hypothetical protein